MTWKEVPLEDVAIDGGFWGARREVNYARTLPHCLDMLERSGTIHNFELAAQGARAGYSGPVFMDSDLYKTVEAVSYSLASRSESALSHRVDAIISTIAAAQRPDGYLNTYYEVNAPDQRFTNLRDNHELYCAGHLFEAAVAHFRATHQRTLLDVATRYADLLCGTFGQGRRAGYPGHPEIELALVKLWRATGQNRYFDLARFFVETRGTGYFAREHGTPLKEYNGVYFLDDVPIREHTEIKGHAVRAGYLMCGAVDVAAVTHDEAMLEMVRRVWLNTTRRRMYITGGIGSSASNEGFTADYDLPNSSAYQETCASVAMVMWNHRLNLLTGDAVYADYVERALYNGVLAGVSLDGTRFFYVNPLSSSGQHHREGWFGCACCPPNAARTIAGLGQYVYAVGPAEIAVNLYVQGTAALSVAETPVRLSVRTNYPWSGDIEVSVEPERAVSFDLLLRKPGWCPSATLQVNDAAAELNERNGYIRLARSWRPGDGVRLHLSMPVQRIQANPAVRNDVGRVALQRGPLIYCIEALDQSAALPQLSVRSHPEPAERWNEKLLDGVATVIAPGEAHAALDWSDSLYQPAGQKRDTQLHAVPYFAWDNREACPMTVWIPG